MVSGTTISRTKGSAGALNPVSPSSRCPCRPALRSRQPRPPLESPRVLIVRRLTASSRHTTCFAGLAFAVFLSALSPGFAVGLCSVPPAGWAVAVVLLPPPRERPSLQALRPAQLRLSPRLRPSPRPLSRLLPARRP